MHSFHLYSFTGWARVKQILTVVLLDKQDATAISINIDHYCLRISEVGMDHCIISAPVLTVVTSQLGIPTLH